MLVLHSTQLTCLSKSPTVTITPPISTVVVTKTATLRKTAYTVVPVVVTTTKTAFCSMPPSQRWPDPTCTITPTLVTAAALSTDSSHSSTKATSSPAATSAAATPVAQKVRRGLFDRAVPLDRAARIAERKARREASQKLHRRAPDSATTTVTQLDTVRIIPACIFLISFADLFTSSLSTLPPLLLSPLMHPQL